MKALPNEITLDEIKKLILHSDILLPQSDCEKFDNRSQRTDYEKTELGKDINVMSYAYKLSQKYISDLDDCILPA